VTRALLAANVLVFVLQALAPQALVGRFALWPLGPNFEIWQPVTYAFLQGGFGHLFFNMFGVWMFGSELERLWGPRRFFVLYLTSVLAAAVTQLLANFVSGDQAPTVGASGGLFGLLLAFAVMFPRRKLMLLFPPIPMPAWLFVSLYGILELVLGLAGPRSGIAHLAHVGGMIGGLIALLAWRQRGTSGRQAG
jgi:membrane associated rhomboid family serine protease